MTSTHDLFIVNLFLIIIILNTIYYETKEV